MDTRLRLHLRRGNVFLWTVAGMMAVVSSSTTTTMTSPSTATTTTTAVSTNPSTSPHSETPTSEIDYECDDDTSANCWGRPDMDCFGIYEPWARTHCPLRCGFCKGKEPPCEDLLSYCQQFEDEACTGESYQVWARINCRKHCNLCTVPTQPPPGIAHNIQWTLSSPEDGAVKYACAGGSITLPWNFVLSTGVVLGDIQWFYEGQTRQMIGITTHGHFLPLPAFASRVHAVGKAGINLSRMTVADSGNYTVEIHLYDDADSATYTLLKRSVFVQISDDLMTQDGYLHVTQRNEAVMDVTSGQWAIELQCGTFTFRGDPAFQVEWITPSRKTMASSDFKDNHFNLRLTNPIQGGNYTCRIPPQEVATTCLNSNGAHKGEATLNVDKMDARFILLERENEELKEANARLQQKMTTLEHVKIAGLEGRVDKLQGLRSSRASSNLSLVVNNVHYNHDNAYNAITGVFTAPLPGAYFFIASTAADRVNTTTTNTGSQYHLMVDDVPVALAETMETQNLHWMGTVHALVHLTRGQTVWLRGDVSVSYWSNGTSFSGFLITPDS